VFLPKMFEICEVLGSVNSQLREMEVIWGGDVGIPFTFPSLSKGCHSSPMHPAPYANPEMMDFTSISHSLF
jgi:hypothetical protein